MKENGNYIQCENLNDYGLSIVKEKNSCFIYDIVNDKIVLYNVKKVDVDKFNEGMLPIMMLIDDTPLWGYYNVVDRSIIKPKYVRVGKFENGYAFVNSINCRPYDEGIINKKGYEIIPAKYHILGTLSDDFIFGIDSDGERYLFDKNWHSMQFDSIVFIDKYLGKNKYGTRDENDSFNYTFYSVSNFIVVKLEIKSIDNADTICYVTDFHGERIAFDDLHKSDKKKIRALIKKENV